MASKPRNPAVAWSLAVLAAAVVILALRESFLGMLFQWRSSSTFSYGVLILPISLFLVWRERERLAGVAPGPAWLALLLMLPAGAVWVLGVILDVNVVHHFAAVTLVILAVWTILGTPVARVIWFPLGYLLLMVPFGEFLVPTLMQWTADFAVLAVSLSGVPVFQDGYVFSLPSGDFEVIKACSGIRFLMATVAAGTVFAWVAYQSWRKRLLFLLACVVVPVVGNLLRAYLVVMLVYLSDGRLAGPHVLYGTVFFGAILLAMFLVGARYADPPRITPGAGLEPVRRGYEAGRPWVAAASAVLATALIAAIPAGLRARAAPAGAGSPPAISGPIAGFSGPVAVGADWQPRVRGAAGQHLARYWPVGATGPVDVFVATFEPSRRTGELTDSRNQVFDDRVWRRVGGGSAAGYTESVLRPAPRSRLPEGTTRLVWSWYAIDGSATDSRIGAKWLELRGLLGGKPFPQAIVALSATFEGGADDARRQLGAFGRTFCADTVVPCPAALAGRPPLKPSR